MVPLLGMDHLQRLYRQRRRRLVTEAGRHGRVGEAREDVPVQVDGVQLDMGHRVHDGDATLAAAWQAGPS
jgi:hypothetical protein